jgi:hypothetical protein
MGNQTLTSLKNKLKAKDGEIKLLQEITASVSYFYHFLPLIFTLVICSFLTPRLNSKISLSFSNYDLGGI